MAEPRTVVFVCPHGAGKSRMAAAWFNVFAPRGWRATTAGLVPQATVSVHAPLLLDGTPAADVLDVAPPRPLSAVPEADLVVAIDCPDESIVASAVRWHLSNVEFDEAMSNELRARAVDLVASLKPA